MCLAVPAKILSVEGDTALVEAKGVRFAASLALVEEAAVGDYLIIHAGYGIRVMDEAQARRSLEMMEKALGMEEGGLGR